MTTAEARCPKSRARYYGVRILYFILWYVLLVLIASGILRIAPSASQFLLSVGFLLLAIAVFSKPLGFWRKAICLLAAAVIHLVCYMLLLFISSLIVGQFSDASMEDGMNALVVLSKVAIAINIVAVIVAVKGQLLLQKHFRNRLVKQ